MAEIGVVFGDRIPERDRSRIEAALKRVAIGEGLGRWPEPPNWIEVIQELTDGRSGALALRIQVGRGERPHTRVAKISSDAAAEWTAFNEIFRREWTILCPPIDAVTVGVLDPAYAQPGEDEAVVYADIGQFAGADATSLEHLVTKAADGEPEAVNAATAVVDRLLHLARIVLYDNCAPTGRTNRQSVSRSLGPAMRVRAERVESSGPLSHVGSAASRSARHLRPRDVLLAALELAGTGEPWAAAGQFEVGSPVVLNGFGLRWDDGRWIASRDYVTVEIAPAGADGDPASLTSLEQVTIYGTVDATRSALTWDRIRRAIPDIEMVEPGNVRMAGTRVAHPFAGLRQLLMGTVTGLVTATVHGDLNPRNVLIADGQPFLIDYARARSNEPILGDLAWLEINLLRGPLSTSLSFAELVHVQRLLALGDRIASVVPDRGRTAIDDALIAGMAENRPQLTAALRILGMIRHHARLIYPDDERAAQPWWREYATQLVLAAHRTCKWLGDAQTENTWRAQVAAAAVATEQLLNPDNPWRLWPRSHLSDAAAAVLPLLPPTQSALSILGDLDSGLDLRSPGPGSQLEQDLRRAHVSILTAIQAVTPARMSALQLAHDRYIDLRATELASSQPQAESDYRTGSAPPSVIGLRPPSSSALTIAAECSQIVVVGGSGTGKTALLDELEYHCIVSISDGHPPEGGQADVAVGRLPVRVPAPELADRATMAANSGEAAIDCLRKWIPVAAPAAESLQALLALGAVHLMVDDFDKVPVDDRRVVADWLNSICARFPRILVTICHRGSEAPAELTCRAPGKLPCWRAIGLGEPTDEQVLGYLARCSATSGPSAAAAAALVSTAAGRSAGHDIGELTRIPLLLSMLASTSGRADQPRTVGGLIDAFVRTLAPTPADGPSPEWVRCAETLAEKLIDSGRVDMTDELLLADADADFAAFWHRTHEQLVELGILARDGSGSQFRLQVYQDYFAARVLRTIAATNRNELTARALKFGWRDAFALFVSFTHAAPDVLRDLIHAVVDADPGYAARLLRSAADRPSALTDWFAQEQERILRDEVMGRVAQERAAQALAGIATSKAYQRLLGILADASAEPAARELSLIALTGAHSTGRPGYHQARLSAELTSQIGMLLADSDVPQPLRIAAIRAVGDLPVRGLELLVADQINGNGPWEVVREAQAALEELRVRLPDGVRAAYDQARADRLTEIERQLPATTSPARANQLQTERYLLLDANCGPDRLPELLKRRFAFEIGEPIADLINAGRATAGSGQDAIAPDWLATIDGQSAPSPEQLLAAITGPDLLTAHAAAHRLLRDQQDLVDRAFELLADDDRADRALMAAAFALLPGVPLTAARNCFLLLLGSYGDGEPQAIEAMSALAGAVAASAKTAGIRLVWQAHRQLAERGREDRLRWPWSSVMARYGGTPAQLDALLSAGSQDDVSIAIDALASSSFLLTGGPGRQHQLSDSARDRLLQECSNAGAPEVVTLLRAAATAALPEALAAMFGTSPARALSDMVTHLKSAAAATLTLPGYGLIEVAPLAEALAAVGYLARLVPNPDRIAAEVHRLLRDIDP